MSKIKFPNEVRTKWLKALRSGRYKQIPGRLQNSQGNCCLGILCRVQKIPHKVFESSTDFGVFDGDNKYLKLIPSALYRSNKHTNFCQKLIDLNDDKEFSFKEIADYIEKRTIGV
jgi:hypothetical protein